MFLNLPDLQDKNSTRKFITYDELRQKNRAEHATKFAGPRVRNGQCPHVSLNFILLFLSLC